MAQKGEGQARKGLAIRGLGNKRPSNARTGEGMGSLGMQELLKERIGLAR